MNRPRHVLPQKWYHDPEGRPHPLRALHLDPSAVLCDHHVTYRQAQAHALQLRLRRAGRRPFSLHGGKRREYPVQVLLGDTAAGIFDLEEYGILRAARSHA